MTRRLLMVLCIGASCLVPCIAHGDVTITQGPTAPTYSTTLNFDEPGTPTGVIDPASYASIGLTELQAGDGVPVVGDFTGSVGPWVGTDNSFFGNFGVFMKFGSGLTEFSGNFWDPSGPPSPIGGGFGVFVFNDDVEVASYFGEPAWGGIGDPAIDITTSGGMVFDEVRVLGFGFSPTTYADDLSWNAVPEPSCGLLIALAGLLATCFRRR